MIKISKIFITVFTCCLFNNSWAQFNYSKRAQEAQNAILELDFVKYDSIKKLQTQTDIGLYYWLDGYKNFVYYNTTSKICDADFVIEPILFSLSAIEKLSDTDPFYYYTLTDLHLFLSFLYLEQDEPIRSLQHYFSAKNLLKTNNEKYPAFEYDNKQLLVQYVINSVINQQLGIKSVSNQEVQNSYIKLLVQYLNTENSIYKRELKLLGIILFNMQYDNQFERVINELDISIDYAKSGPIEAITSAMLYKKADSYSGQLSIFENTNKLGYQNNLNVLSLWHGNALLNRQNDSAIYFLNEFLMNQQNLKFVQYAQFKASMYWFLKGDVSKSNYYNNKIKLSTLQITSEDKQAFYEINHAAFWTKELVLARVLFDGGEFKKALDVLLAAKSNVANYSNEQKLEYSYRIARIYDKFNDIEKAKKFYLMVINSNLDDRFYYPAYAAFYLGNLYALKGDIEKANVYYQICTELDSPIYKTSIHSKAKQAIQ